MDIKKMQSVMLSKGLRVTDDDPIFSVATLAELALNEANTKHLEHLNIALQTLQKFQGEMRTIGDAVLSAAEILTIGRQFLRGENEQVLEDVSSIKGSIATIAQQISNNTIQDRDRLNKIVEAINASLTHIVNSMNDSRSVLQARNEAFLICRIKEITTAVQQVKDIETLLHSAARDRIDSLITPVLQQITEQVKILSGNNTFVMGLIKKTNATQEKMVANIWIICAGIGLLVVSAFAAGFYLRPTLAG